MEREKLGSRLGFILLSAGCAIGIGNVWKFPYMVGQYGGGIFVLLYLFFLVVLGVPVPSSAHSFQMRIPLSWSQDTFDEPDRNHRSSPTTDLRCTRFVVISGKPLDRS